MMEKNSSMDAKQSIGFDDDDDINKWVHDSSLDYKGRVPLRASTGSWKASLFIVSIEFSERMSHYGLSTSLVLYLTKILHQDIETAAKNVNYWAGVTTLMPLFGGFLADGYIGRYYTVIASCIVYVMGLVLLSLSWFLPGLRPYDDHTDHTSTEPKRIHKVAFFLAIYLISIGTGGHKPSLQSFGADQFDDDHPNERVQKMSFFNWWGCCVCSGVILGVTLISYVQDHVSWGVADVILTIVMAFTLLIFIIGRTCYRYKEPVGSPFTPLFQVLVAAISKRKLPHPSNSNELYEDFESLRRNGRLLGHTKKLKFLDKAAILEHDGNSTIKKSPWKLATVTKVEEMKLIINMIPMWLLTLPYGLCLSQIGTFFIKQSSMMDRKIGNKFEIPSTSFSSLSAIGMIISVAIYDKILVPILRRLNGNERGMNILHRIGIGMVFLIISIIVAALVEKKRLEFVHKNPLKQGSLRIMSVFWLAPQFFIVGFGDGFTIVGLQEYFYDQVPDSMRSLGIGIYLSVFGAGSFLSSFLITIVDHVTKKNGNNWFGEDLNNSHLDRFYWLVAVITMLNLFVFVLFARGYSYKNVQKVEVDECYGNKCGVGTQV